MEGAPGDRREALKQGPVKITLVFRPPSQRASAATREAACLGARRRAAKHDEERQKSRRFAALPQPKGAGGPRSLGSP